MKYIIPIMIILLLLSSGFVGVSNTIEKSTLSFDGKTLYVGGSGGGNYTEIQDAIDNASDGDTVYVYNGTYIENLVVDKSINLVGEDRNITVIDGDKRGDVIFIAADSVNVSGFTIKDCKEPGDDYQYTVIKIIGYNDVVIKGNIISTGDFEGYHALTAAIYLRNASNNLIQDNIITNEDIVKRTIGVMLGDYTTCNNISGNEISMYLYGVDMYSSDYLASCNNNIIYGNYIHNNCRGVESYGIKNKILNNVVSANSYNGIMIWYANDITIFGNIVTDNGEGDYDDRGIELFLSKNIILTENIISRNNPVGVYCMGSYKNHITNNHISNNVQIGIYAFYSNNCDISRNNFIDNGNYNAVFENQIIGSFSTKWKENYWSDYKGRGVYFIDGRVYLLRLVFFSFRWFNFDWHPAKEPYDIGV